MWMCVPRVFAKPVRIWAVASFGHPRHCPSPLNLRRTLQYNTSQINEGDWYRINCSLILCLPRIASNGIDAQPKPPTTSPDSGTHTDRGSGPSARGLLVGPECKVRLQGKRLGDLVSVEVDSLTYDGM